MAFLPCILLSIIKTFFSLKAGAECQLQLAVWYFSFLIIFVLFVTVISRSFVATIADILYNPSSAIQMLSSNLPYASHFYVNYIVFGWIALAFEMTRLMNVLKYIVYRVLYGLDCLLAKTLSETEDETAYGMGARITLASFNTVIALVFCQVCPLICCIAFIYFFLGRIVYGCLLFRTEGKKPDLGGAFWVTAMRQLYFGLTIYATMMTGVISDHSKTWAPVIAASFSLAFVVFAWSRFQSSDWQLGPLDRAALEASKQTAMLAVDSQGQYVQPECRSKENPECTN